MIKTKTKAAFVIKKLEIISAELGRIGDDIFDEDSKLTEQIFRITSEVMFDVTGPIIDAYPSLRPVAMLGCKFKNSTYNIIKHNNITNEDFIECAGLSPKVATTELEKIEMENSQNKDCFFYMELNQVNT